MSDRFRASSKIYISLKHGETIVKDLHTQFKEGRNCDLEIRLNKKRLYVHKCLIDTFFIKAGAELEDDRFYLDLTRFSQPVVEALIGLVYTGNLCCALDQVENVFKAAMELGCVEAQTGCKTYIRDNCISTPVVQASEDSEPSSPEPPEEPDPHVIIKTEPVDDSEDITTESFEEPAKIEKDYRSTIAVPIANHALGISQPVYHYTLDSPMGNRNFQQNSTYNISNANIYPSLPAPQTKKPSPKKKNIEYVFPRTADDKLPGKTTAGAGKKRGRPPKVAYLGKEIVDKLRRKLNADVPEKHNFSATTEDLPVDEITNKTGITTPVVPASEDSVPSSPEPPEEPDPHVIIKTEPVDDSEDITTESFEEPAKIEKDYRSTIAVPISNHALGISPPVYHNTLDNPLDNRNFQQNSTYNISNANIYPSLPAPKTIKTSPKKKNIEYVFPRTTDDKLPGKTTAGAGKRRRRPPKVAYVGKEIVEKIRNKLKLKHNFSATTEDLPVDEITNKTGNKDNLVEHRTKTGTVYYKYVDPRSLSKDEFSVDAEEVDNVSSNKTDSEVRNGKATALSGSDTDKLGAALPSNERRESSESERQTVLEKWMESVSTIVKVEAEAETSQTASGVEDDIEAQKNEQMFSLGLTNKVDKSSLDKEENAAEKSGKRRLRARKKVDYNRISEERSDLDESSDYDPYEYVAPKKKFKSYTPTKGKNLKIDAESLVTIDPQRVVNLGTKKPHSGSTTIAVRQDIKNVDSDRDSEADGTAYFPPAGSVPDGVNSRYAQGKYMKVKYVTESIKDSRGYITVVRKPIPVRPRQFGMDERLMNRPAVYVCHPTAPVVKQFVRKPKH